MRPFMQWDFPWVPTRSPFILVSNRKKQEEDSPVKAAIALSNPWE